MNPQRYYNGLVSVIASRSTSSTDTLAGLVAAFEVEQKIKPANISKRYIWALSMQDGIKVVVTMNVILASIMHDVLYLVCDFTFKRVLGELNEWEVTVFYQRQMKRRCISILRWLSF
jgi:hypothetical protein